MAVSENIKKKPLTLGESYDLARSGIGVYKALDPGDKQLWMWGYNSHGELADSTRNYRSSPNQVPGTNWNNIAIGNHHMLATKQDGTGWAWGYNNHSQLGDCGCTSQSSPNQLPGNNWCFMSASDCTSFGMKTDGTLWAWGHNNWGQLGLTETSCCCCWDEGVGCCRCRYACPVQLGGNTWKCVSATRHSAGGIKCDGTLWVWGIETRCNGMYGLKTDGTLWSWGHGSHGSNGIKQGSGDIMCPVQIPGSNWIEISAMSHGTHARKNDNTLWGWGYNAHCELGDTSSAPRSSPVQIFSSKTWIELGQNGFAGYSGLAFDQDCAMWMWGHNDYGQLGICCKSRMCSPVQVGPDCGWVCGGSGRHATGVIRCFS